MHLCRLRTLYRNQQGRWRRVRSYWDLWRTNRYCKPNRWDRGGSRKIGRHLYRLRVQYRWTGAKWVVIRRYWRLYRRNYHNHHLHGRYQWRWGRYRRISVHRYRLRILYRNYQGHWRKVRSYWHLWCRNH